MTSDSRYSCGGMVYDFNRLLVAPVVRVEVDNINLCVDSKAENDSWNWSDIRFAKSKQVVFTWQLECVHANE